MKQKGECNECGEFRVLNTEYDTCNPCVKKHKISQSLKMMFLDYTNPILMKRYLIKL